MVQTLIYSNIGLPCTLSCKFIEDYFAVFHDDVIEWKPFPRYWPFVRGIHRWPAQRPVTRSFDVFFDLRLNKRLSKQSWGWWFETPSCPLWRHCNVSCYQTGVFAIFSKHAIEYKCSRLESASRPWIQILQIVNSPEKIYDTRPNYFSM